MEAHRGAPVGVVGGHRREVEHLARQGARVERAPGLGEDGPGGVRDAEHAPGHLRVGDGARKQRGHGQDHDDRARRLHALGARLDEEELFAPVRLALDRHEARHDEVGRKGLQVERRSEAGP